MDKAMLFAAQNMLKSFGAEEKLLTHEEAELELAQLLSAAKSGRVELHKVFSKKADGYMGLIAVPVEAAVSK